jgi:hypothetical protein
MDIREITVSPAQAVASLERVLGASLQVNHINLRRIQDAMVYEVAAKNGGPHLVDARSGQLFTITPEVAEQIARDNFPSDAPVFQSELVTRHNLSYPGGPLPAQRIVFDDDRSTVYYVSVYDGTVRHSNRESRIRRAIVSLHTFEPIKLITKQNAVRKGMLVLLSLLGIGAALTGYFLALQRR